MTIFLLLFTASIFILLYGVSIYNKLVRKKNLVQEGWSSIDVMLKKRHDLIPNLIETVKGYANHEKSTLDAVVQARSQALGANTVQDRQAAENQLSRSMMNLLVVAEQYPDLKANANFQQLQAQLTDLESGIEKSRRYYNGTVRDFNILIESFPSNIVANAFRYEQAAFFELDNDSERAVPQVKF